MILAAEVIAVSLNVVSVMFWDRYVMLNDVTPTVADMCDVTKVSVILQVGVIVIVATDIDNTP